MVEDVIVIFNEQVFVNVGMGVEELQVLVLVVEMLWCNVGDF